MTQALAEQERARSSIRAMVKHQGARLRDATPAGMVAALVAAACMPVAWPLLGSVPEPLKAAVGLLGSVGGGYIGDFVRDTIERLRRQDGAPRSEAELQDALERELLAGLEGQDERAAMLRADAAVLLQSVYGVQAALEAASAELQRTLAEKLSEFSSMQDESFRMLTEIQRGQRHNTDLTRQTLVTMQLTLRRLAAPVMAPAVPDEPEDQDPAPGLCPYKGLAVFEAEDAQWFFGRERLIAELTVRLSEHPFLAVVGPSGSGKSSVLRAGLLPGVSMWTALVLTPGAHPLEELAAQLGAACGVPGGAFLDDWRADTGRVRLAVRQVLAKEPEGARLLLLVDQFEEIFTRCSDEAERRGFIHALTGLASDAGSGASVVLGSARISTAAVRSIPSWSR